jgi:GNAT superfamily N-acetyltransferase
MTDTMQISAATVADSEAVAAMAVELLEEIMALTGARRFHADRAMIGRQCADWLEEGGYRIYLARPPSGGSPLGFISAVEMRALYAGGCFGMIPELYVRPSFRGEGIGRALLDAVKAQGRQRGWARLEVTTPPLPQFERTLSFYQREGFEVAGGRKMKAAL